MERRLLVVGGGNMGTALVRGLLTAGWEPRSLVVAESDPHRRVALEGSLSGAEVRSDLVGAQGAVLAVKPQDAERACRALGRIGVPRALSIIAGVTLSRLESWIGVGSVVVRAMPNTPALVGAGVSALAGGSETGEEDLRWAEEILAAVGKVVRVPERFLDAVTGLSGSGPGYLFYVVEAMIAAGVQAGLSDEVSRELVLHTFAGSARLLLESGEPPEVLRGRVTSPGGTTEAGLRVLGEREVARAFADAVAAAAARSRELGA